MKPALQKGQLITWKDDRGFGFIKTDSGGKEVFLHISALKGAGRRPKVGDTILYEQVAEPNGKIRAARASIQGVASQSLPTPRKNRKGSLRENIIGFVILAAIFLITQDLRTDHEKPSSWTIFGGAERPQKSSNYVSPVQSSLVLVVLPL